MTREGPLGRHDLLNVRGLGATRYRPWPTTVLCRWRWEIGGVVVTGLALAASIRVAGAVLTMVAASALFGLGFIGPVRDLVVRRAWVIIVQHRIRVGCIEAGIHGRSGRPPGVCWTSSVRSGEDILLWLPAGVTVSDVEQERERLASACWAQTVHVRAHRRHAQLVSVVVQRWGRPKDRSGQGDSPTEPSVEKPADDESDLYRPPAQRRAS